MFFEDKVIWITGASSGIGEALAYELSRQKAQLILSGRNSAKLETVKSSCVSPEKHLMIPLDMTQPDSLLSAVEQVRSQAPQVDILIHCAGVSQRSFASETRLEVDRTIMETNYFGTVTLTKALLPSMMKSKSGHIVVISSVVGKFGSPLRSAYAASKHALHGFFDSLRAELWQSGIRITMVCPGFIKTEISRYALTADGTPYGKLDEGQLQGISASQCARAILKGVQQGKSEILIGRKEKLGVYINRFFPSLFERIIRKTQVL